MGRTKNNKHKRKQENDIEKESPIKKAKLAESPPEAAAPEEAKTETKVEKTSEKPKFDPSESVATFLKSKGPFSDEIASLLSQFKRLYQKNADKIELGLPKSVEFYLKKCDFSFKWISTTNKSQLFIEQFLIAEAPTKESACAKLIKMFAQKAALQFVAPKKLFVHRPLPSITQAKDADLLKLLPKLTAFKSAFDNFKQKNVATVDKVYACAKTSGVAVRQINSYDKVASCGKSLIAVGGFVVCERTGETKLIARGQAFDSLLEEIKNLIEKCEKIAVLTVDEADLENGGDGSEVKEVDLCGAEFVLFELPGCDAQRILNYSAEMNNNSLVFKVSRGIAAFSLGGNFVAAVENNVDEPLMNLAQAAVEKLKRRCYTVVVKKQFADITVERNDILTESKVDLPRVEKILKDFSLSYKMHSVVFSSDFTDAEKESICKLAKAIWLDVIATPVLTVKRKKMLMEVFMGVLLDNGGSVDGYELIAPQNHIL